MDPVIIRCFVCNIKTDDWRSNLNGLKSQHSDTLISDIIKKILGNRTIRNIDDDTNCICTDCVNKIEEYDWTLLLAKRCENELYEILLYTETMCTSDGGDTETDFSTIRTPIDTKDNQCDDLLLVEAFTPIIQMNYDGAIEEEPAIQQTDKMPVEQMTCDATLSSPSINAKLENDDDEEYQTNECDPDFEEVYESDESSYEEASVEDDDFIPSKSLSNAAVDATPEEDEKVKRRGRPRTRPTNESEEKKKIGRPRTRPPIERTRKREKKVHECKECEKVFTKQVEFVLHKRWHREQQIPKFRCSKCFYISDDQESFDIHAKLHENADPLQCVICNTKVSCKGTLTKHTKSHQAIQNYQCHLCGKQFHRSMSLKIHMKYHLNIRNKQCPHCPMTFVESKNLNRHLKTHTQIKPYSCSVCGKRFAHSYNVKPHERTHFDSNVYRKYACNWCRSAFDSKAKLSQHLQKSHSMVTPHLENTNNLNDTSLTGSRWAVKEMLQKEEPQTEPI